MWCELSEKKLVEDPRFEAGVELRQGSDYEAAIEFFSELAATHDPGNAADAPLWLAPLYYEYGSTLVCVVETARAAEESAAGVEGGAEGEAAPALAVSAAAAEAEEAVKNEDTDGSAPTGKRKRPAESDEPGARGCRVTLPQMCRYVYATMCTVSARILTQALRCVEGTSTSEDGSGDGKKKAKSGVGQGEDSHGIKEAAEAPGDGIGDGGEDEVIHHEGGRELEH